MWRLKAGDGRWVQYDDDGTVTGSQVGLAADAGRYGPVEVVPLGDVYDPPDDRDSVSVFLRARRLLGQSAFVAFGHPPVLPGPAPYAPGAIS